MKAEKVAKTKDVVSSESEVASKESAPVEPTTGEGKVDAAAVDEKATTDSESGESTSAKSGEDEQKDATK